MRFLSSYTVVLTIGIWLLAWSCAVFAQPPDGYQWFARALAYAGRFYDYPFINPDYGYFTDENGDYANDCAHFTSQIANAGCSGMCEYNSTNWSGWNHGDCPYFMYDGYLSNCRTCPSGNHQVYSYAEYQNSWFVDNEDYFPDYACFVYNLESVPDWVGPGTFFIVHYLNPEGWHAMFIGGGQGQNATYWAHTADDADRPISAMFNWSRFHFANFWGPGTSPVWSGFKAGV